MVLCLQSLKEAEDMGRYISCRFLQAIAFLDCFVSSLGETAVEWCKGSQKYSQITKYCLCNAFLKSEWTWNDWVLFCWLTWSLMPKNYKNSLIDNWCAQRILVQSQTIISITFNHNNHHTTYITIRRYMYVYLFIYIYIYVYAHCNMYGYHYMYIDDFIHVYDYVWIYIYIYAWLCMSTCIYIYIIYTHDLYTYVCLYMYILWYDTCVYI